MTEEEKIEIPLWWLKRVRKALDGELPSGRIGDAVFLLRCNLDDLIERKPLSKG